MILALAQTRPLPGDVDGNVEAHLRYINLAADKGADVIVFPELSLTGYEPKLAADLALTLDNPRLGVFGERSTQLEMIIAVGLPLKTDDGVQIGMPTFQPGQAPLGYGKKYIHPDEEPFFVPGNNYPPLRIKGMRLSPAICYELSIDKHREDAIEAGADIYVASVAKVTKGTVAAHKTLSEMARNHGIFTAMVNCVGPAATGITVGQSAVWGKYGELVKLDETETALLFFDTEKSSAAKLAVNP